MGGSDFLLAMVAIAFGLLWTSIYVYLLLVLGRKLARSYRLKVGLRPAGVFFCAVGFLTTAPVFLLDMHIIMRIMGFICLWLLHAPPLFLGYWWQADQLREEDLRRWKTNTESWVNTWEEQQAPEWLRKLDE